MTHYWARDGFITEGQEILQRIHELDGLPGYLIHGRRDISGPVVTAWQLQHRWPSSELTIMADEGHCGLQPISTLSAAVEKIAARF